MDSIVLMSPRRMAPISSCRSWQCRGQMWYMSYTHGAGLASSAAIASEPSASAMARI